MVYTQQLEFKSCHKVVTIDVNKNGQVFTVLFHFYIIAIFFTEHRHLFVSAIYQPILIR